MCSQNSNFTLFISVLLVFLDVPRKHKIISRKPSTACQFDNFSNFVFFLFYLYSFRSRFVRIRRVAVVVVVVVVVAGSFRSLGLIYHFDISFNLCAFVGRLWELK